VSLFKQILLMITVLLLTTLIIVLKINFDTTKEYIVNESYLNAKNNANMLALTLNANPGDDLYMQTSINAMFDGGYFESITMTSQNGNVLYEAKEEIAVHGVPEFFINTVNITIPEAEAQVMNGWTIAGLLKIKSHPGSSYKKLWDTLKKLSLQFIILGCIISIISAVGLRALLTALEKIKYQAEQISNNEFIITDKIPSTPELKQLAITMNTMVTKVKAIFERDLKNLTRYQELRYTDKITGLHNRTSFIKKLGEYIESDDLSKGQILTVGISGMEKREISSDRPLINYVFKLVGEILKTQLEIVPFSIAARFSGREFFCIFPDCDDPQSTEIAKKINDSFALKLKDLTPVPIGIHCGLSSYTAEDDLGTIMSKADYALSKARADLSGAIRKFREDPSQTVLGKTEWRNMIENAILENRFLLSAQPVVSDDGEFHREVFITMADSDGKEHRAGMFMPMVLALGLANRLDRYILELAEQFLVSNGQLKLTVNITTQFCLDRMAGPWLRDFLLRRKHLKDRLLFEIHENTLIQHPDICIDIAGLIMGMGFKFGIDQYTIQEASLKLLEKVRPYYIKIERDYLEVFDDPEKANMVLNSLFNISDTLGIKLIATKVENDAQRSSLSEKNITLFQGYGIAKASPLKD